MGARSAMPSLSRLRSSRDDHSSSRDRLDALRRPRLCAALLSERIVLDDHGFPIITDPVIEEGLLRPARRTVAVCPRLALRLEPGPSSTR